MADNIFNIAASVEFADLEKTATNANNRLQSAFNRRPIQIKIQDDATAPLGRITAGLGQFDRALDASTKRVVAFGITAGILFKVKQGLDEFVHSAIEVQDAMTKINVGLNLSATGLNNFKSQIFDIARNTGQTFGEVAEAAQQLSRQNLGAAETAKRLQDAMSLARNAGISASEAVTAITSAYNSFRKQGLDTTAILDNLVAVNLKMGTSTEVFTEAIQRSGEVAQQAGIKFQTLVAYISSIQKVTQRGGAAIGTSLSTFFANLARPEIRQDLTQYGVNTVNQQGQPLGGEAIIKNLATRFPQLNQTAQANLLEKLTGKRQEENILPLLEDVTKATGNIAEAINVQANAAGKGAETNNKYNESLKSIYQSAKTTAAQLASTIAEKPVGNTLRGGVSLINSTREFFSAKSDPNSSKLGENLGKGILEGITNVISGPGLAIVAAILGSGVKKAIGFALGDLKDLAGINAETQKREALQKQIVSLLQAGTNEERAQFLAATDIVSKKEALLAIETRLSSELAKQAGLTVSIGEALSLEERGLLMGGPKVRGAKGIINLSGGYMDAISAEMSDIKSGVGGASASAKPVVVPRFNFGDGRIESVVANTDEHIVRNFAGGGDAIFNKEMVKQYGLPNGAKHLAKGILNLADPIGRKVFPNQPLTTEEAAQIPGGNFALRNAAGQNISKSDLEGINKLLDKVKEAGTVAKNSDLGEQIEKIGKGLNAASRGKFNKAVEYAQSPTGQAKFDVAKGLTFFDNTTSGKRGEETLAKIQAEVRERGKINRPYNASEYIGQRESFPEKALAAEQELIDKQTRLVERQETEVKGKAALSRQQGGEGLSRGLLGAAFIVPLLEPLVKEAVRTALPNVDLDKGTTGKVIGGVEGAINLGTVGLALEPVIAKAVPTALGKAIAAVTVPLILAGFGAYAGVKGAAKRQAEEGAGQAPPAQTPAPTPPGVFGGESGSPSLLPRAFLRYGEKEQQAFQQFGAQSRAFNFDTSRNGPFTTPAQRAQSVIGFYDEFASLAGIQDIENNPLAPTYKRNRQIVQNQNVTDLAGRFLQGRNPGGRYFDFRGQPITQAIEQGLQRQQEQTNNPEVSQEAGALLFALQSSTVGLPKKTYGITTVGGDPSLHSYIGINDPKFAEARSRNAQAHGFLEKNSPAFAEAAARNEKRHNFHRAPDFFERNLSNEIPRYGRDFNPQNFGPNSGNLNSQSDFANFQKQQKIEISPIKIDIAGEIFKKLESPDFYRQHFGHLQTIAERANALGGPTGLSTEIIDELVLKVGEKIWEKLKEWGQRQKDQVNAVKNGKPLPPQNVNTPANQNSSFNRDFKTLSGGI